MLLLLNYRNVIYAYQLHHTENSYSKNKYYIQMFQYHNHPHYADIQHNEFEFSSPLRYIEDIS